MAGDGPNGRNGSSRNRRGLSEEDRLLWAEVVRRTTPLHGQPRLRDTTALPERQAPDAAEPPKPPRPVRPRVAPKPSPPRPRGEAVPVGRPHPGLDRRTAERLRRGERAPDARIDLHGMTADAAHAALDAFIGRAAAQGLRFLLVITGKGGRGGEAGVLRSAVPGWLRAGPHGTRILGIFEAHRRHGGAGALYVYLRKPG